MTNNWHEGGLGGKSELSFGFLTKKVKKQRSENRHRRIIMKKF